MTQGYRTPTLPEFTVGFEFEIYIQNVWIACKYSYAFTKAMLEDGLYGGYKSIIRVKEIIA